MGKEDNKVGFHLRKQSKGKDQSEYNRDCFNRVHNHTIKTSLLSWCVSISQLSFKFCISGSVSPIATLFIQPRSSIQDDFPIDDCPPFMNNIHRPGIPPQISGRKPLRSSDTGLLIIVIVAGTTFGIPPTTFTAYLHVIKV